MRALQIDDRQMKISLSGLQSPVSQHLLHVAQIRAVLQHMRRAGMSPQMTSDVGAKASADGRFLDNLAEGTCAEWACVAGEEENVGRFAVEQLLAHMADVIDEEPACDST